MSTTAPGAITDIPLDDLHESPFNPRQHYDDTALAELAADCRSRAWFAPVVGWLQRPRRCGQHQRSQAGASRRQHGAAMEGARS